MLKFEILLSCMNSNGLDLIKRSRITSDVLVVNQCGKEDFYREKKNGACIRIFSVKGKGLTKSRNFALRNSAADICLLCDDDEVFHKGYENKIIRAYEKIRDADVIIFDMGNRPSAFPKKVKRLGFIDTMKVSSWQISFRRESILKKGIAFDEDMGAGTPNGAEEEFKFLTDCRRAGLKIYYVPAVIADVAQESSTWFNGFDKTFFINRGNTTRYIMGLPLSVMYGFYYCFAKRKMIGKSISPAKALMYTLKGIFENRFKRLKRN